MTNEIALIGNQNSGKTTLFNLLTGSKQKIGNWAGVTVEKKEGNYKKDKTIKFIDLPGLYSLSVDSIDEKVVVNYLEKETPSAVINVLDGSNLERGLILTLELISLKIPVVVAINMADELEKRGIKIDEKRLSELLGAPVIKISAKKNINIDLLVKSAKNLIKERLKLAEIKVNKPDYAYIKEIISKTVSRTFYENKTEKIDKIILNKYLGIPIFFIAMLLVYFLSIKLGGLLGEKISLAFNNLSSNTAIGLQKLDAPKFLISLICDAFIVGVGSVVAFLPQILILFTCMTILEESGYMSRVVFLFDRIFYSLSLSGKSLIPIILSCGCAVTGVTASRTIEDEGERTSTIFLAPFMPCGAKFAVFIWLSEKLFYKSALIATSLYFTSIFSIIIGGLILKKLKLIKTTPSHFILDMPSYRTPTIKNLFYVLTEKAKDFLFKAGTTIFSITVILWFLTNFSFRGYNNGDIENSFLRLLGGSFRYLFYPLGLDNWQISVSILSGIFAKEAVIGSLSFFGGEISSLFINSFSAYAFMTFILLSPPCIATLITAKKELKNNKTFCKMLAFQFIYSYLLSTIINILGIIYYKGLLTTIIILVIIIVALIFSIKVSVKYKCKNCTNCKRCKGRKNER